MLAARSTVSATLKHQKLKDNDMAENHLDNRVALALKMAAKGFGVFPCRPNTKEPACYWQQEATTDPDAIRAWPQDVNYGVAMDTGHFVLDLDCKGEATGRDALNILEIDYDTVPTTFAVKTPSGGEHLYSG